MRSLLKLLVLMFALCVALSSSPRAATAEPARITGTVVDYRAQPVEDASVLLYNEPLEARSVRQTLVKLAETQSSADGRFDLTVERNDEASPHKWWLMAYKKGLAMCWTTQNLGLRPSMLRLGRAKPLGGVVVDETGRPVAGARVSLCVKNEMMEPRELPLPGPEDWHSRRTDNDGRFLFDNLPADTTADFKIEAPGQARAWTFRDFGTREGEQFPVGRTDIRITLHPEARIEGTVVDEDTGAPVYTVRVLARPHERAGARYCEEPVTVDSNGGFVLTGLAAGTHVLEVVAPEDRAQDWFASVLVPAVQHGQTTRNVRLAVNRGATLEVVMREPDSDTGVPGARIRVTCDRFARALMTDAGGLVRLRVPPGKCTISGYKDGYGGAYPEHEVELKEGQIHREEMRLTVMAVHVSGTVCTEDGHALAGSAVGPWPFWHSSTSEAEGRFQYTYYTTGSGSKHTVLVRHESSGLANIVELRDSSGNRRLNGEIVLKPAYTLVGRVTDPNGAGIPAASVRLVICESSRSPHRVSTLAEIVTNANGIYPFRGIPKPVADCYYAAVAHAPGYNETSVDPVHLEGPVEKPIHLRTLTLQPADQVISGMVVDGHDKGVPDALVETPRLRPSEWYAEHDDTAQPHRQVFTDAQGRFYIDGICRGPVEITARTPTPDSREGITYTSADEKNVKIVLGQTLSFGRSLIGTRLPSLADFGLREQAPGLEGKAILLCFLDVQQRPSRHVLRQLAEYSAELAGRSIVLLIVQAASCDANELAKLVAEHGGETCCGNVADNEENVQRSWGIQSLPWLVLADSSHVIRAEGFAPAALEEKINELSRD